LEAHIYEFADFRAFAFDEGLPGSEWIEAGPNGLDDGYDTLEGVVRLRALETALASGRVSWGDDPSERASNWISLPEKAGRVLKDFEAAERGGDEFRGYGIASVGRTRRRQLKP